MDDISGHIFKNGDGLATRSGWPPEVPDWVNIESHGDSNFSFTPRVRGVRLC